MTRISNACKLLVEMMKKMPVEPYCDANIRFIIDGKKVLDQWPVALHQTRALQKQVTVISQKTQTFITFLQETNKKP